ncbi:S8 family peptidase [Robertkochia aurantiaca]|uniref:S8 family peptidase n=1 Tax=Robertkochia aurantiaca TaxID=2873700 RepID=UPI001CCF0990|nr:S8 family peptidase [Robertkochia sp. 3YJGBD-33]
MKKTYVKWLAGCMIVPVMMLSCSKDSIDGTETTALDGVETAATADYIVVLNTKVTGDFGQKFTDYTAAKAAVNDEANRILNERGIVDAWVNHVYSKALNGFVVSLSAAEAEKLRQDARIDYIEEDQMFSLAPPPGKGPGGGDDGGGSTGQETPYGITRVNGVSNYTGSGVAWVLDSGIDLDHPDLNVDASRGFNAFTSGRDSKSLDDGDGHGTHVAGTIAAINNSIGVIGVAPGATVIPVKVLDSRGSGSYSGVIAGIDHVAANGAPGDVANMSLGGGASQAVDDAVVNAAAQGVIFTIAAGNSGADSNNYSPARAEGTNVYTISAMDSSDNWASFSNYANPPVDYCAPGVAISSTWKDGGYNTISGTSMAAPHAAGVFLLGAVTTSGTVNGDPDGNPDPIIVNGNGA